MSKARKPANKDEDYLYRKMPDHVKKLGETYRKTRRQEQRRAFQEAQKKDFQ